MKFHLEIDPEKDADAVGEHLRGFFFDQTEGQGCYESFKLNEGVSLLDPQILQEETWTCASLVYRGNTICGERIKMMYHWDGDGTLIFIFNDGSGIYNNDCKKDHTWRYLHNCADYFAFQG
jgi:hypothetical protein